MGRSLAVTASSYAAGNADGIHGVGNAVPLATITSNNAGRDARRRVCGVGDAVAVATTTSDYNASHTKRIRRVGDADDVTGKDE